MSIKRAIRNLRSKEFKNQYDGFTEIDAITKSTSNTDIIAGIKADLYHIYTANAVTDPKVSTGSKVWALNALSCINAKAVDIQKLDITRLMDVIFTTMLDPGVAWNALVIVRKLAERYKLEKFTIDLLTKKLQEFLKNEGYKSILDQVNSTNWDDAEETVYQAIQRTINALK